MDLEKFGDSYDIVKQSFLRWLSPCGAWTADPMFTKTVTLNEAKEFSSFLGVGLVTWAKFPYKAGRPDYFNKAKLCTDHLLLDPDTGLRLPPTSPTRRHLMATELLAIAQARPKRLTLVYDQSISRSGGSPKSQIKKKLVWLEDHGLHGFAYVSHVCFILVSLYQHALHNARDKFLQASRLPTTRIVLGRR